MRISILPYLFSIQSSGLFFHLFIRINLLSFVWRYFLFSPEFRDCALHDTFFLVSNGNAKREMGQEYLAVPEVSAVTEQCILGLGRGR